MTERAQPLIGLQAGDTVSLTRVADGVYEIDLNSDGTAVRAITSGPGIVITDPLLNGIFEIAATGADTGGPSMLATEDDHTFTGTLTADPDVQYEFPADGVFNVRLTVALTTSDATSDAEGTGLVAVTGTPTLVGNFAEFIKAAASNATAAVAFDSGDTCTWTLTNGGDGADTVYLRTETVRVTATAGDVVGYKARQTSGSGTVKRTSASIEVWPLPSAGFGGHYWSMVPGSFGGRRD